MKRLSYVDLGLIYIVLVWGSIFTAIKLITLRIPLDAANGLRFLLTALIFTAILAVLRDWRLSAPDAALMAVIGLVGFGAYQLLSSYGISKAVVAGSALIMATVPVFTALFGSLFRIERVGAAGWWGIAIGFAGILLIVLGEHGTQAVQLTGVEGETAVVAGAACWALGAVVSKPLMRRHSSIKITSYSSVLGSLVVLPFLWRDMAAENWSAADPTAMGLIIFWVIAGNVIGQLIRFHGVKHIGPNRATAYVYFVPFSAAAIAGLVLGSPVGWHHLAGGAVIFVGVALVRTGRVAEEKSKSSLSSP